MSQLSDAVRCAEEKSYDEGYTAGKHDALVLGGVDVDNLVSDADDLARAAKWAEHHVSGATMPGAREMFKICLAAILDCLKRQKGCDWCSFFQEERDQYYVEDYTREYYKCCPICGKALPNDRN